jgi:type II secretory pathway component PulJ
MRHIPSQKLATHRRLGSMIAEVTLVAAISSVLMGLVIVGIHSLLKSHENHRDTIRNSIVQQRLGNMFRRDCRHAQSASADENQLSLDMTGGKTIKYSIDKDVVARSWSGEENTGSDRFSSTRNWTCRLELKDGRASLHLEQAIGGSKRTLMGKTRAVVFEATIGQHSNLAKSLSDATSTTEERQ